jgi:hypothetical protein
MNFQQVFENIFDGVTEHLKKKIAANEAAELSSKSSGLQGSGGQDIDFNIDGSGNAVYKFNKYGAGVTVHCTAWITAPDDVWDVTIQSSDGGGGDWHGLKIGQKIAFNLQTSFWHGTDFTITVHAANLRNQSGKAHLDYTY